MITRFRVGNFVQTKGKYFAKREIMGIDGDKYVTRFLDDDSIVETNINVIDDNYELIVIMRNLNNER